MSDPTSPSSTKPAKRSPRLTLQRIMDAARDEFAEQGLHGASVEDIARRAGISKQLLHRYFGSKEDLYRVVLERSSAASVTAFLSADLEHLAPEDALRAFIVRLFDQYDQDRTLPSLALDQSLHGAAHVTASNQLRSVAPQVAARVAAIFERGIASGAFRDDIDPGKFFAAAFLLTDGFLMCSPVLSMLVDMDVQTDAGRAAWREFAADLLLAALRP